MASYLKPKRGAYSAISSTILQSGEIFFETPKGVGGGKGRLMMGDGSNTYSALASSSKYFLDLDSTPVAYSNFSGSDSTATNTFSNLAGSLGSGTVTLPTLTRVVKRALYNMSAVYVALKNEITSAVSWDNISGKPTTIAGYGITDALKLGNTSTTAAAGNHNHDGRYAKTNQAITSITSDGSQYTATKADGTFFTFSQGRVTPILNPVTNCYIEKSGNIVNIQMHGVRYGDIKNYIIPYEYKPQNMVRVTGTCYNNGSGRYSVIHNNITNSGSLATWHYISITEGGKLYLMNNDDDLIYINISYVVQ